MTELEQTLLRALKALDEEHSAAKQRMDSMSQHIEQQQRQIDQLTTAVKELQGSVVPLAKSVSDCLDTLKSSSRPR